MRGQVDPEGEALSADGTFVRLLSGVQLAVQSETRGQNEHIGNWSRSDTHSPEVGPPRKCLVTGFAVVRLDPTVTGVNLHVGHDGVAALEDLVAHGAHVAALALQFDSANGGLLVQLLVNEQIVGLGEAPFAGIALEERPRAGGS